MEKVMEAVKEASISIACCLDEVEDVTQQDLEHIHAMFPAGVTVDMSVLSFHTIYLYLKVFEFNYKL